MLTFLSNVLSGFLANILPAFIPNVWEKYVMQRGLKRPPKNMLTEIKVFLEILFPENPPELREKNCRYLPDSRAFFMEKVDILDSLERDTNGRVAILCRVPWLVMPDNYRDIYLNSPEARAYYSLLEKQARNGKLKYLYNLNALRKQNLLDSIQRGISLHCLPMLLTSTNFDVMIVQTDRHRTKIIFATRPIGFRDQEVGVIVEQRDMYLVFSAYFDKLWDEADSFWKQQLEKGVSPMLEEVVHPIIAT